jgi:hypothetical protein
MARIAKPAKYGQKTGAGIENTTSVSAGAGILGSVARKVVSHNNHLKRHRYDHYDSATKKTATGVSEAEIPVVVRQLRGLLTAGRERM